MPDVTLHIRFTALGHEVEGAVSVPADPAPRRLFLPILQRLTDTIVQITEQNSPLPVSCKKGCDACCRQMVPISPAEAFHLAHLMETLPPGQASQILQRFDAALEQLADLDVLDRLHNRHQLSPLQQQQLDRDYFAAQIPCPFLEDHACSIHPARPLACREFLVTSPARNCSTPTADQVTQLPLPAKLSVALATTDQFPWLPLILARTFVAKNPEALTPTPPAHELQKILNSL